jgi:hypothetical protein
MECARCGTRFRIEQSGLLTERTAPDVARTEPLDPPRRRLAPGTKIGLVVCLVPLTILLLGVLWFVVWGGRQRRISAEAARQFLEDLLVAERVPLAYQRCSTAFRKKFPERTLLKYARAFPRKEMEELTLVGTTMTTGHDTVQVRFSCRFRSTHQLVLFVDMSESSGTWLVDGFGIYKP